jgi:hypothetical protein
VTETESSNWRELNNLVESLEGVCRRHRPRGCELLLFTDNTTADIPLSASSEVLSGKPVGNHQHKSNGSVSVVGLSGSVQKETKVNVYSGDPPNLFPAVYIWCSLPGW